MLAIYEVAFKWLETAGQNALPIDEKAVADALGAAVVPYSSGESELKQLGIWDYAQTVQGVSLYGNQSPLIFYSDGLSYIERRSIILHECGHIALGHVGLNRVLGKSADPIQESKQESEADAFARAAAMPPHLLRQTHTTTTESIQQACHVSKKDAQAAVKYLRSAPGAVPLVSEPEPAPAPEPMPDVGPMPHRDYAKEEYLESVILDCGNELDREMKKVRRLRSAIYIMAVALVVSASVYFAAPFWSTPVPSASQPVIAAGMMPDPTPIAPSSPIGDTYYWTQGGEVYHTKEDCFALKQATYPIQSGTLEEAQSYKSRECSFCGK